MPSRVIGAEVGLSQGRISAIIQLGLSLLAYGEEQGILVARWDPENLWIDIRLRSLANQVVNFESLGMLVPFAAGEEMRTEISTKFARSGLEGIYAEAGLELTDWWTDSEGMFALSLARATD